MFVVRLGRRLQDCAHGRVNHYRLRMAAPLSYPPEYDPSHSMLDL